MEFCNENIQYDTTFYTIYFAKASQQNNVFERYNIANNQPDNKHSTISLIDHLFKQCSANNYRLYPSQSLQKQVSKTMFSKDTRLQTTSQTTNTPSV